MIDESKWHNTGGNGAASATWSRKVGTRTAVVHVMPYRAMLDLWVGTIQAVEGMAFDSAALAITWADRWFARIAEASRHLDMIRKS